MRLPITLRRPNNATLAVAVSFCTAFYVYLPVYTLYLQSRGLNLLEINTISSAIVATQFLAEAPTGVFADRFGRRLSWVLAILLQFIGEVWFFFAHSYIEFLLIGLIAGLGFAFLSGAMEALVYDSLPAAGRELGMKKALGQISAASRIGNLLGFLLCGLVMAQVTPGHFSLAVGLTAGSVGLGFLLTTLTREQRLAQAAGEERTSSLQILKSGFGALKQNPALRRVALLLILSDPFGFYLIALIQPYFVRAGLPAASFGPLLAAGSLLAALGERYSYLIEGRLGMRWGLLLGTALPGLLYLLMAPVRQAWLVVPLFLLEYGSMYALRPVLRAYLNGHIPSESRATVLSMVSLLGSIYLALAGPLLGFVGDRSIEAVFFLMGAVVLAAALLLRVDEQHRAAPAQEGDQAAL